MEGQIRPTIFNLQGDIQGSVYLAVIVEVLSEIFDFNTSAWQRTTYAETETWHLVSEGFNLTSLEPSLELGAREGDCLNHPKFLACYVLIEEL